MRDALLLFVADVDGEVATSDNLWVAAGLPESVQRVHQLFGCEEGKGGRESEGEREKEEGKKGGKGERREERGREQMEGRREREILQCYQVQYVTFY